MYRSTFFLTSALVGGEWSTSRTQPLYPRGKNPRYPLDRRLGWPQSRSGRFGEEKFLNLPRLELRPFGRPARIIIFYYKYWGRWSPYWVHSALRPLPASATCPGWLWGWRSWWNERFWQGKPKYSEKTCPDATLSTTNPTCQIRLPYKWENRAEQ
jgi:hypothetical protein